MLLIDTGQIMIYATDALYFISLAQNKVITKKRTGKIQTLNVTYTHARYVFFRGLIESNSSYNTRAIPFCVCLNFPIYLSRVH